MFQVGQQIGNYTLVKPLGRGGFGDVWLADRQTKFVTTKVAVKLPHREKIDAELIKQEASLWAQASGHPNVLPIIEADEYDGQIMIVSEYATGGTLEDLLQREQFLTEKRAIELAVGILNGLEFLHSRDIIHRDIKPANVLLQEGMPRLTDFGMSRLLAENSLSVGAYGTPYYMAPEAFSRKRNVQTDIWSVGVVLYKMLLGEYPFPGDDVGEIYAAVYNDPLPELPEHIAPELRTVVKKALEKSPEKRYTRAAAMSEDLLNCLPSVSAEHRTRPAKSTAGLENSKAQSTSKIIKFNDTDEARVATRSKALFSTKLKRQFINPRIAVPAALGLLIFFTAGSFFFYHPSLVPFRKGDKFGFSTWGKRLVVGAKYDLVQPFSPNLALVAVGQKTDDKFTGKYGFIDKRGREMIALDYDYAESFSDNLAKVGRVDPATGQAKFGFIDERGQIAIPLNYGDARSFSNGLAPVKFQNKWGALDRNGGLAVPFKYDDIEDFSNGLAVVRLDDKFGYVDIAGNEVIEPNFETAGQFCDGVAPVTSDGKAFFIDRQGRQALPFKYAHANSFAEGLAMVTQNGKSGFIERTGGELFPLDYENDDSRFSEGLAAIKLKGKMGFIDKGGKTVIGFRYASAAPIKNNVALVKTDSGKEFYLGFDGTEFYEP